MAIFYPVLNYTTSSLCVLYFIVAPDAATGEAWMNEECDFA